MRHSIAGLVAMTALIAGISAAGAQGTRKALAEMKTADGGPAGTVELTETPNGVLLVIGLLGLAPGEHGIHLHETGSCEPDFDAAGDHFAPDGNEHGYFNDAGPHAGDLPNIIVNVEGNAAAHAFTNRISFDGAEDGLLDTDGAAVIVHELADTYGADAGAGARVACGVIEARF